MLFVFFQQTIELARLSLNQVTSIHTFDFFEALWQPPGFCQQNPPGVRFKPFEITQAGCFRVADQILNQIKRRMGI
jgi:hypothetical protein